MWKDLVHVFGRLFFELDLGEPALVRHHVHHSPDIVDDQILPLLVVSANAGVNNTVLAGKHSPDDLSNRNIRVRDFVQLGISHYFV